MKPLITASLMLSAAFYLPDTNASCFQFQSSMWQNLHHHLYRLAKPPRGETSPLKDPGYNKAEQQTVDAAVLFYKNNFAENSLLFNKRLRNIKGFLGAQADNLPLNNKTLSVELRGHLNATAPIYQKYYWADHNQSNNQWIKNLQPLLTDHESSVQKALEKQFKHQLCEEPIKYDIVAPNAYWAGAYSTPNPGHVVITSTRDNYLGLAALEISFHEGAHVMLLDTMEAQLAAIEKEGGYPHERDLWHAILFYTVGETIRQNYLEQGITNYQPYAYKRGIYARAWGDYERMIVKHWQPYLENKTTMKVALTAILDGLRMIKDKK